MDPSQKKEDVGSRFLSRVGSVFRRRSRRTESAVSNTIAPDVATPATNIPTSTSGFQPTTTTTVTAGPDASAGTAAVVAAVAASPIEPRDSTPVVQWSSIQQERARALFAKYGLTLEADQWMFNPPRDVQIKRVEKPIRMRVRRSCHRCQTTFGVDKICANCQHARCKKCPRYPPLRTPEEKEARALAKAQQHINKDAETARPGATTTATATAGTIRAAEPPAPESAPAKKQNQTKKHQLTIPSRTGGQDLVYRKPRQRVRRTCHRCQTLFKADSKECANCAHIRCKKCPRDPPNLEKYPDGYPGDVDPPPERPQRVWRKARMRVRYYCHQCDTAYVSGEQTCRNCGQEKGPETRRDPPKKVKPELDPEVVRRVQERLASLQVNDG